MPSQQNTIAQVQVGVTSNAQTVLPQQIQAGVNAAQKSLKPINLKVNLQGANGQNFQKQFALGKLTGDVKDFESSIKAATARTVAFGLAAGGLYQLSQGLSLIVTTSIEVEKRLKEIQVISNASAKDFQQYSKGIFDAARSTSESFSNAATAALEFARQGLSLDEQLRRTKDALTLTKIAGIDATKAVEAITAAMNTFSRELSSSGDLVDRLTNLDNAFAVSTEDLAEGLSRVGNTAQEAGVSLNETLSAITALQQRTARGGAVIGNALKSIFTRAGRPENIELLNSLGIATEKANGASRSSLDVLRDLAVRYKDLGEAQKRQIGEQFAGLYQINQFQALIKDLGSNYSITEAALNKVGSSSGTAAKRIEELNTTTSALLQQSTTSLTQLSSQLANLTFESPLKKFLEFTGGNGGLLKGITDYLSGIQEGGDSIGENFGRGLLDGIGKAITGPGIILISALIGKALSIGFSYIKDVAGSLLGINRQLTQQALLQNQINSAIVNASSADQIRFRNAVSLNEQLLIGLSIIQKQAALSATVINPLTSLAYRGGLRPGAGPNGTPRRAADGYTPMRQEINAIQSSPDYNGARNARPQVLQDFSIGGRKQPVIINSAEKVVPTRSIFGGYSGPDKYSILNPRQQKMMGFAGGYYGVGQSILRSPLYRQSFTSEGATKEFFKSITSRKDISPFDALNLFSEHNTVHNIQKNKSYIRPLQRGDIGGHREPSPFGFRGLRASQDTTPFHLTSAEELYNILTKNKPISSLGSHNNSYGGLDRVHFGSQISTASSYGQLGYIINPHSVVNRGGHFATADTNTAYNFTTKDIHSKDLLSLFAAPEASLGKKSIKGGFKLFNPSSGGLDEAIEHISKFRKGLGLYSSGYIPNFAAEFGSNKQYVFSPELGASNKERELSRKTGFELITQSDLQTLSRKKLSSIPLLKIYDPSRTLGDYLENNPKLRQKIYTSQASDFKLDKFQETGLSKNFEKSINLQNFDFKSGGIKETLARLKAELGKDFLVKGKFGAAGDAHISAQNLINTRYYNKSDYREAYQISDRHAEQVLLIKQLQRNPGMFFAQRRVKNPGPEFRVPAVGTFEGARALGAFDRYGLNSSGTNLSLADKEGGNFSISKGNRSLAKKAMSLVKQTINDIPRNLRRRLVIGADSFRKKFVEFNPTDPVGYSGALDNPVVRGLSASVLRKEGKIDVSRYTDTGKKLLNYQGNSREAKFTRFNSALQNLQKVDEIAYNQIAANLGRFGFGIEAGGKTLKGKSAINKYFARRGFGSGYIPNFANNVLGYHGTRSSNFGGKISSGLSGGEGQGKGFYFFINKKDATSHAKDFLKEMGGTPKLIAGKFNKNNVIPDYEVHTPEALTFLRQNKNLTSDLGGINIGTKGISLKSLEHQEDGIRFISTLGGHTLKKKYNYGTKGDIGTGMYLGPLFDELRKKHPEKIRNFELSLLNAKIQNKGSGAFRYIGEDVKAFAKDLTKTREFPRGFKAPPFGLTFQGSRGFHSNGYIPNFANPLRDAINREAQSVPNSSIYVDHVNTPKYRGPVVANTRDEPTRSSLLKAVNSRMSNGYVPNFASQIPGYITKLSGEGSSKSLKTYNIEQERIRVEAEALKLQKKQLRETQRQNAAQSRETETAIRSGRLTEQINKLKFGVLGSTDKILDNLIKQNKFNPLNPSTKAARSTASIALQNRRAQLGSGLGFGAAFGLPMLAGQVESFGGDNPGTRLASGALSTAGTGAAVGLMFGPKGAAIGAGVGLAAGAGKALIDEPEIQRKAGFKRQAEKVDKKRAQANIGDQIIQSKGQLQDLISSGASQTTITNKSREISALQSQIKDEKLRKIFLPNEKLSAADKLEQEIGGVSKFAESANQDERFVGSKLGLSNYNNRSTFMEKASLLGFRGISNKIRGRTFNDQALSKRDVNFKEKFNVIDDYARSASERTDFGVDEETLKKARRAGGEEEIFSTLRSGFKGTDQEFQEKRDRLNKDYLNEARKTGDAGAVLNRLLIEEIKEQKTITENKKRQAELTAQIVDKTKLVRELNKSSLDRTYNNFSANQGRESNLFSRNINLQKQSPFLTDLQKSLEENDIGLQKSKSDITGQKETNFSNLLTELTQKNITDDKFPKLKEELQKLQTSTPETIDANLKALTDKLGKLEGGTDQVPNNRAKDDLGQIKDNFDATNRILDATQTEAEKQSNLTAQLIKVSEENGRKIAAFGGISAIGKRGNTFSNYGSGATNAYDKSLRERKNAAAVGSPPSFDKSLIEKNDQLSINAANEQINNYRTLLGTGLKPEEAREGIDLDVVAKANAVDIRKTTLDASKALISNSSSTFAENIPGLKDFDKIKNPQQLIDKLDSRKFSNPDSQKEQERLRALLVPLAERFKNSESIGATQRDEEFKITPPSLKTDMEKSADQDLKKIKYAQNLDKRIEAAKASQDRAGEAFYAAPQMQDEDQADQTNFNYQTYQNRTKDLNKLEEEKEGLNKKQKIEDDNKLLMGYLKPTEQKAPERTPEQLQKEKEDKDNTTKQDLTKQNTDALNNVNTSLATLAEKLTGKEGEKTGENKEGQSGGGTIAINISGGGSSPDMEQVRAAIEQALAPLKYKIENVMTKTKTVIAPISRTPLQDSGQTL